MNNQHLGEEPYNSVLVHPGPLSCFICDLTMVQDGLKGCYTASDLSAGYLWIVSDTVVSLLIL